MRISSGAFENYIAHPNKNEILFVMSIAAELEIQNDLGMPVNYVRIKSLEDRIRKHIISDKNSLHSAITPVLLLAHFLAIFPIQGIYGPNTTYLK